MSMRNRRVSGSITTCCGNSKGCPRRWSTGSFAAAKFASTKGGPAPIPRVQAGDSIRLPPLRRPPPPSDPTFSAAAAPPRAFAVLFEDDCLLALDKPAGVAVHGGSGVQFGVIEQLRAARPEARFLELVHRLDRETSGILLIAKKRSALTRLQAQFRERAIAKTYLGARPRRLASAAQGARSAAAQVHPVRRRAPRARGGCAGSGRHARGHAGQGGRAALRVSACSK